MIFSETCLQGAYLIELERVEDDRGFFARSWCRREFEDHGLETTVAQCNVSFNHHRGTIRGLHFQLPPHAETKLVRCTRGSLFDVLLDLRPDSESFLDWFALELVSGDDRMLYIPKGIAHGFQTLQDDTEVHYQMSEFWAPDFARGVRWDDPLFNIAWPFPVTTISENDRGYPDATPSQFSVLSSQLL